MTWQDVVNGSFELGMSLFILLSIHKAYRDKLVRGVSVLHVAFPWCWGLWNLYYYPHLGQWLSFWGGVAVVTANGVWLSQLVYYTRHPGGRGAR